MSPVEQVLRSGRYCRDLDWSAEVNPESIALLSRSQQNSNRCVHEMMLLLHRKRGVQMRVTKEVSDDMLLSDIGNVAFEEVPWIAPSVELFFEDPELPSLLIAHTTADEIEQVMGLPLAGDRLPRVMSRMDTNDKQVGMMISNLKANLWDRIINQGEQVTMSGANSITGMDSAAFTEMMRLAIKVFAYASLPRYAPEKVVTISRAMGGKPGFKGRPNRPAMRVVYLPLVHTVTGDGITGHTGRSVEPHDRRGHFRIYRHERYTDMRGQRQFIAPIRVLGGRHGKVGVDKLYIVRNP